jgi:LmbE family N-acetylglucosaminyl deacetylase
MPKRAFAVVAHPDDIEFVMAGTLLHLQAAGYEIHCMNIANGCCGSTQYGREELAKLRHLEALDACQSVGAVYHESIAPDLEVFYDRPTLARLASIMRLVAPEILLVHAPSDYMEDHMNSCRLAVTAAFTRGMPNFPVDPPRPPIDQPVTIYHAQPHGNRDPLGAVVHPHYYVDIGDVLARKTDMLGRHRSQRGWLDESQGFDSYLQTMHDLMREVGRMSGRFEFAEGWRKHHYPGFCAPEADPLVAALGDRCLVAS